MLTALLVASLLSQLDGGVTSAPSSTPAVSESSDAGVKPFSAAIYAECPEAGDAGLAEPVDGGWFLPTIRAQRTACLLAACEEDRRYRASPEAVTPSWVWPVTVVADVVLKAGVAIATWGITKATSTQPQPPAP